VSRSKSGNIFCFAPINGSTDDRAGIAIANITHDSDLRNSNQIGFEVKPFIEGIKGHSVHINPERMKNICVMCREMYMVEDTVFEQRLIADEDFCRRCWGDIMNSTYDNDLENDFSKIRIPV
jgi:hypothetical protein